MGEKPNIIPESQEPSDNPKPLGEIIQKVLPFIEIPSDLDEKAAIIAKTHFATDPSIEKKDLGSEGEGLLIELATITEQLREAGAQGDPELEKKLKEIQWSLDQNKMDQIEHKRNNP